MKKKQEFTLGYKKGQALTDLLAEFGCTKETPFVGGHDEELVFSKLDDLFMGQRRSQTEIDNDMRQAIAYLIPTVRNDAGELESIFVYQRAAGSEAKLEGNYSIGVGGHVEGMDIVFDGSQRILQSHDTVCRSASRERVEEIDLGLEVRDIRYLGFVAETNDDPGYIGNTHIGFAYTLELDAPYTGAKMVDPRYTSIGWMGIDELRANMDRMEPWAKLILESILP